MFQQILVPVDLADWHESALEIAARLVTRDAGEVTVLHVIEVLHGLPREEDPKFYNRLEQKSRARLDLLTTRLKAKGVRARPVVLYGERVPEVLRYTLQERVDLIVLSSQPLDPGQPGGGLSTMSHLIGAAARCPVMLVKGEPPAS
jgi:nucleotide-binding universal stress UspA family protein